MATQTPTLPNTATTDVKRCANPTCQREVTKLIKGRCSTCYDWLRRHGTERKGRLQASPTPEPETTELAVRIPVTAADLEILRDVTSPLDAASVPDTPHGPPPDAATTDQEAAPAADTPADPKIRLLLDLVGQGPEAIAAALRRGLIQVRLPGKKVTRAGANADAARVSAALLERVPAPMRTAILEDRKAGMSYVQIDLKHGFEDAVKTRGRVSWTVCKAAERAKAAAQSDKSLARHRLGPVWPRHLLL